MIGVYGVLGGTAVFLAWLWWRAKKDARRAEEWRQSWVRTLDDIQRLPEKAQSWHDWGWD